MICFIKPKTLFFKLDLSQFDVFKYLTNKNVSNKTFVRNNVFFNQFVVGKIRRYRYVIVEIKATMLIVEIPEADNELIAQT